MTSSRPAPLNPLDPLDPIAAVNRLTLRMIRSCTDESSAFCAPSAWPLLALLAHAAHGPGRAELEDAIGLPAAAGRTAALEILARLRGMTAVQAAAGIWAAEQCPLDPAWIAGLPVDTVDRLTGDAARDTERLDGWARRNTGGLIEKLPIRVGEETLLVLAAAMSVRTRWLRPFDEWPRIWQFETGPWQGRTGFGLSRFSRTLDRVAVHATAQGEITCLDILGEDGITVHLVIGEQDRSARDVLEGGLLALARTGDGGRSAGRLQVGDTAPGLVVEQLSDPAPDDRLLISVPRFRTDGDLDLLARPQVFGLDTVTDAARGHFPAISRVPLAVSQARQGATASFTAKGFEAAAVTAAGLRLGAALPPAVRRIKQIRVELDRPFGFLAAHRDSGLILAAGWVAEPALLEPPPRLP